MFSTIENCIIEIFVWLLQRTFTFSAQKKKYPASGSIKLPKNDFNDIMELTKMKNFGKDFKFLNYKVLDFFITRIIKFATWYKYRIIKLLETKNSEK